MLGFIRSSKRLTAASLVATGLALGACGQQQEQAGTGETQPGQSPASPAGGQEVSGPVAIDGSSTVFPISQAVAEEFQGANPDAQVSVASSGTGGGMKKFCSGEVDIANASRPIKQEEVEACKKSGIQFIELPVALDGLAVVVNPKNNFAQCLSVEELKKAWAPTATGKVTKWSQVRSGFPSQPMKLYGPGTDSGTFDYFTDAIVGEEGASRTDYTPSEDDNVLVQGVAGDPGALGYFGVGYYEENQDKLKLVQVKNPETGACTAPVPVENVVNGSYAPLSRPLFIYVSQKSINEKPSVKAFTDFYVQNARNVVEQVGYVPLPEDVSTKVEERVATAKTGSIFQNFEPGTPIAEPLNK